MSLYVLWIPYQTKAADVIRTNGFVWELAFFFLLACWGSHEASTSYSFLHCRQAFHSPSACSESLSCFGNKQTKKPCSQLSASQGHACRKESTWKLSLIIGQICASHHLQNRNNTHTHTHLNISTIVLGGFMHCCIKLSWLSPECNAVHFVDTINKMWFES